MSTTPSEIFNPIPGLPPKDVVVRLCKKKGFTFNTLTYSAEGNTFFIRYNNVTMEEAHAQVFFRQNSMDRDNFTIRIPEVYHAFEAGGGRESTSHFRVDQIPPPPGVFGSFTGGEYRHHFFRDSEPPVPLGSVAQLEAFLNKCLELYKEVLGRRYTLDFSSEPLLCYYADVHPSNFPIDKHGQLWVVNFAQAGVLPSSFMSYAIAASTKKRLPVAIRRTIPLPETSNLAALGRATYVLKINSYIKFDIDRDNRTEADADPASAS